MFIVVSLLILMLFLLLVVLPLVLSNHTTKFQEDYREIMKINDMLNQYIKSGKEQEQITIIKSGHLFIYFSSLDEAYTKLEELIDISLEVYDEIDESKKINLNLSYLSEDLIEIKKDIRLKRWKGE